MHKARIINEYETEMGDNGIVKICEADFETKSDLPAGTKVKVSIPFDKVDVTDDEADGTVSAHSPHARLCRGVSLSCKLHPSVLRRQQLRRADLIPADQRRARKRERQRPRVRL